MMKSSYVIIFLFLGFGVPTWSLAAQGDAMPGMAAQGIVRLPHEGMVDQTFRSRGRPGMRRYWTPSINSSRIDTQTKSAPSRGRKRLGTEGADDASGELVLPDTMHEQ